MFFFFNSIVSTAPLRIRLREQRQEVNQDELQLDADEFDIFDLGKEI